MEELNLFIVKELKELGITAWHGSAPQEFAEYNEYVEQCKKQVKNK